MDPAATPPCHWYWRYRLRGGRLLRDRPEFRSVLRSRVRASTARWLAPCGSGGVCDLVGVREAVHGGASATSPAIVGGSRRSMIRRLGTRTFSRSAGYRPHDLGQVSTSDPVEWVGIVL